MTRLLFVMLIACTLTSCTQWSRFPELDRVMPADDELACDALDDEILKANALRDAIIDEQLRRRGVMSGYTVGAALLSPLTLAGRTFKHKRIDDDYRRAAIAAEDRMRHLLETKQANNCQQALTADAAMSEYRLLEKIIDADDRWLSGDIDSKSHRKERLILFDDLRPGPAQREDNSAR
ncbi:MAG: hypothetical protein HKN49_10755 [Gammaproteobacteria bacterium]|nr:hypothetical protein [Gammaproteobacteria bacterium]